jgi:hypothetical protein
MDAGIGAPRSDEGYTAGCYCFQGFFNFSLYAAVLLLALPAMISAAIVFNNQLKISYHGWSGLFYSQG